MSMKYPFMTMPDETEITHSSIFEENGVEIKEFQDILEKGSHVIYKFARQGGFGNAANF